MARVTDPLSSSSGVLLQLDLALVHHHRTPQTLAAQVGLYEEVRGHFFGNCSHDRVSVRVGASVRVRARVGANRVSAVCKCLG